MKKQLLFVLVLAILGVSLQGRGGGGRGGGWHGGGGRGGWHGGGGYHGGWRGRGWGGGYRGWGYGPYWGGPYYGSGITFGVTSGGSSCYKPGGAYSAYPEDPLKNPYDYKRWLQENYTNWQDQWNDFQDYQACKNANKPRVGVGVGVGVGSPGYYGYRRWR